MMGLGDIIQKVTKATGIEKAVKFIAGEDCGCDARRDKLNKLFPIKKPLCLTEDEYNWLTEFREKKTDTLTGVESKTLSAIYTRVFQTRKTYSPCHCDPNAWNDLIGNLNDIYNTYQN